MTVRLLQNTSNIGYCLIDQHGNLIGEANEFLTALHTRGLSPYTLRAYGYDLVALYRWMHQSNTQVSDLTCSRLLDFVGARRQTNAHPRSINRMLMTTRSFYRFCTGKELEAKQGELPAPHYRGRGRDRWLGINSVRAPQHRLLQIKVPKTLIEPLTIEQVRDLLASTSRHRDICIIYFMLFCGLRSQEVINLKLSDVSLTEGHVRVKGKGNKERMLPLPAPVSIAIIRYLQLERPQHSQEAALFVVLQGKHRGMSMTPAGLRNLFRHRRRQQSLKNANAHRLRHTFGTDMARLGTSLPILQRLMGHSDPKVTLQYINLSMADISTEFTRACELIAKRYTER